MCFRSRNDTKFVQSRLWLCRRIAKMLLFNGNLYSSYICWYSVKNNLLKPNCEIWAISYDLKRFDLLWSPSCLTHGCCVYLKVTTSDIEKFNSPRIKSSKSHKAFVMLILNQNICLSKYQIYEKSFIWLS